MEFIIPLCSWNFQNVKLRQHGVDILQFASCSNFTWNQIFLNSNDRKISILAFLEVLNSNFGITEPFLKSEIYQNSKLRVSEIVKIAIFVIQILPKLISHKIEWQIDSCIVDLNFTFWKFLEHSGAGCSIWNFIITYLLLLSNDTDAIILFLV